MISTRNCSVRSIENRGINIKPIQIMARRKLRNATRHCVMMPRVLQPPEQETRSCRRHERNKCAGSSANGQTLRSQSIDTSDSCVSAGMPTVHGIMYFGMRCDAIMSHGCTSTAAPSSAQ